MTDQNYQNILNKIKNPNKWMDACLNDLYFLCRSVLFTLEDNTPGFKDLHKPTHKRICDFIQENAKEGNKCLVLTPRGWVKSYVITIGWTMQRLLNNLVNGKREHQIISNATIGNAKSFLEKIKYNLKYNELLRGLFKEWIPKDPDNEAEKWTQDCIQLLGNLIETGSVEGNLVSQHYKVMINDDLVNKDNSATKEQLEKTEDWWKLSQSLLQSNGIEINIGTRWAYDDLYGQFIKKFIEPDYEYMESGQPIVELHKGNYHMLWMDCWSDPVHETGSTFPTLFPEVKLKELQKQQGDRFPGQYRNNPLALGKNPFKKNWFVRWAPKTDLPKVRNTVMLIDPSGKASIDSDYSGVTVIHLTAQKTGLIEFGKRLLITDRALAEWIILNAPKFMADSIYIEDMKYKTIFELMELLIPDMIRHQSIPKENLEYVKMIPYILQPCSPKGRPKEVRIKHLTGMFENGTFALPYNGAEDLEEELIRYPSTKDDVVDSLAYIMDFLIFPKPTDHPKALTLDESEKMTDLEREEKEWDEIRESVFAGSIVTEEDI